MHSEDLGRPCIVVGRDSGDHVAIHVLGRMHTGADDFWDGNWLVTPVEIAVGDFSGEIGAALRAEEFRAFRQGLQKLSAAMSGQAELASMEEWLTLSVAVEPSGRLSVRGRARDRLVGGNALSFRIDDLDQSDLPAIIDALEEVEVFFPVVGSP